MNDKTAEQLMPCLGCDDLRCNDCFESKCRELGYTRADSGEAVAFDGPKDDRAMLLYLMQAFDTESWQCPQCGKDEECATMDSAYLLRDYLVANPHTTAVDVRDASRWRQFVEMIDPDKVPSGFTVYYAIEEGTDQLCYFDCVTELVDAAIASREGE